MPTIRLNQMKEAIIQQFEKYKGMYKEYKDNMAFVEEAEGQNLMEAMAKNKLLSDRIMMFHLSFSPGAEIASMSMKTYTKTPYYITSTNIYMLATALHNKRASFILPIRMLERLLEVPSVFRTEDEALDFLEYYETSKRRAR